MPTFQITDPQTGKQIRVTGDSPPSEQELEQIFASQRPVEKPVDPFIQRAAGAFGLQQPTQQQLAQLPPTSEIGQAGFEPAAAIVSGAIAEPVAGLAGLAATPFVGGEEGGQIVGDVREALTVRPETQSGQQALQQAGEGLAPVGEALGALEKGAGDIAFKATGSPALAAIAATLPAATMEAIGFGIGRRVAKSATGLPGAPKKPIGAKPSERAVTKSLLESAPEVSQIKDASRAIYKEIDDLKVTTKPIATKMMLSRVIRKAKQANVDEVLTPKSARVIKQLGDEFADSRPRTISELDQMRKKAQIAAQSIDPADARVGAIMVDEIDEFLDNIPQKAFSGPDAKTVGQIGDRFKAARSLWGRARRSELISEAFDKANLQASGFENGIRTQLRSILNNKKRSRFFTKDELGAMTDVVKGEVGSNTLKLIGRLGFSEGSATNILGGLGGVAVFGPTAPVIGQISRKLAQKSTKAAATKMEALVRSGAEGRKIATAYMQSIPKAQRSVQELSDLFLASGSEVDDLLNNASKMVKEAAEITAARKLFQSAEAMGAAAPATAMTVTQQEQ